MSTRIRRRQGVDDDVARIALHLLDQSEALAIRFIDAVQVTLKDLARAPRIGSLKQYESPRLAGVRSWWVRGFRNHLVFYFATDDGIDVLAVAHGAQDVERLLYSRV
ncbi:MAG: type II toxin-antitoxin system RelE/ParE family toxin [Tepidisphaeraceae bacterium]